MGRFSVLPQAEKLSKVSSASRLDSCCEEIFAVALRVPSTSFKSSAMRLRSAEKVIYAAAQFFTRLDLSIDTARYCRAERPRRAPPIPDNERHQRQSTHFDLRVGVDNPRFPPVYTAAHAPYAAS